MPDYHDAQKADDLCNELVSVAEAMAVSNQIDLRDVMWGTMRAASMILAKSSLMMHHQSGHETDDDFAFTLMGRMALLFEHQKLQIQREMRELSLMEMDDREMRQRSGDAPMEADDDETARPD